MHRPPLLIYLLFAAVFMFLVPPLETPDEGHHLNYVNYVSRHLALPNQYVPEKSVIGEGHQYPLYYMAGAALVRLLQSDHGVELTDVPNKKHRLLGGDSLTVPSFRHVGVDIFTTPSDRFAFYSLRALAVLFGLLTVFFIGRLAGLFIDDPRWAAFAAALAGTLPQFIFISMSVSNDGLSNALAAAALFYMAKIAVAKDIRPDWKSYLWLAVVLGLGVATKKSGLVLLLPAAIVLIRSIWRRFKCRREKQKNCEESRGSGTTWQSDPLGRPERSEGSHSASRNPKTYSRAMRALAPAAVVILIIVILAGGVFVRNQVLYGELLGNRMEMKTLEPLGLVDEKTPTLSYVVNDFFGRIGVSFVGMFGQWASSLPAAVNYFYLVLLILGLAGVVISLKKKKLPPFYAFLLTAALLATLGAVFYYNLTYTQPQGRLLFPALGAIAVLTAVGIKELVDKIKAPSWRVG